MEWITGAGPEEEQRLEEGVRDEVEDRRGEGADPGGEEHEPELGNGRVGQHLLDVVLLYGDGRRDQRGEHADTRDDRLADRRERVKDGGTRHHVHARGDHGRRVDQGGHRRGTRHGVGQPYVQGHLRALPRGPQHEQQGDGGNRGAARGQLALGSGEDLAEVEGPEGLVDQEHGQQEADVPDPVDDERLLARVGLLAVAEPVPDQEIAAESDALPPHEHGGVPGTHDQHQHEEDEEVEVGEVPRIPDVVLHVADTEDVDQEADPGDHEHHDGGELVQLQGGLDPQVAGRDPAPVRADNGLLQIVRHPDEVQQREHECDQHHPRPHQGREPVRRGGYRAREGIPLVPAADGRGRTRPPPAAQGTR